MLLGWIYTLRFLDAAASIINLIASSLFLGLLSMLRAYSMIIAFSAPGLLLKSLWWQWLHINWFLRFYDDNFKLQTEGCDLDSVCDLKLLIVIMEAEESVYTVY